MFEQVPSPPAVTDPRRATRAFAFLFPAFLASLVIASFRWLGHTWSLGRKIAMAEFILGMVVSGLFLLTAKSVTPQNNKSDFGPSCGSF